MAVIFSTKGCKGSVSKNSGSCPECGGALESEQKLDDRSTYKCVRCNASITILKGLPGARKPPKSRGGLLIRDRSKERKEDTSRGQEDLSRKSKPKERSMDDGKDDGKDLLAQIREAMEGHRVLSFQYVSSTGKTTSRNIEPYKLTVNKKGEIMLFGYCLEGEGIRTFKIKGVSGYLVQLYGYEPRWPVEDQLDTTETKDATEKQADE